MKEQQPLISSDAPRVNKNNRKFATITGGAVGVVASISLAALGCALYGLPWDVMLLFTALYGALSGAALGFLLNTFLADN